MICLTRFKQIIQRRAKYFKNRRKNNAMQANYSARRQMFEDPRHTFDVKLNRGKRDGDRNGKIDTLDLRPVLRLHLRPDSRPNLRPNKRSHT